MSGGGQPEPLRENASPVDAELRRRVAKLERINAALMAHVERATDQHGGAYSLFQTAIMLDNRVKARTEELTALMLSLERSNIALTAAKEDAERANRSKTRFLAAASHDLLQPLNAARLSISALADLPLQEDARAVAGQVERGLVAIEELIKTLLDISKLDAGVVRPAVRPVRLRPLLDEVENGFWRLAETKGLRLVVRGGGDLAVTTDPALLARILANLVSNALRYTSEGGVVLAARRQAGRCLVEVVDTGPGIPEAERDLVFEEFFRGREASGEAGLGLGLSIVRRMADALGHALELRSRPGHGTRFRLGLPLAGSVPRENTPPEVARPTSAAFRTRMSVAVVENDRDTAAALLRLLDGWGAAARAYRDAEEWHADAGRGLPDVLVVDYHLDGGRTGLEAVAAIRAALGLAIPAVVVTADHTAAIEAAAVAAGCEILRKPVVPAQLRALLAFLAEGAEVQSDARC